MRTVPLGELIKASGRRAGSAVDIPVYSVTKYDGFVPSSQYFKKQVFSRDLSAYKVVEQGEFAYASIHLDEGSIGIAPERALVSPMYTAFKANSSIVDPSYLVKYLKSGRALAHYEQLGRGAVHRRKSISLNALNELPVPLPPLDEQRRIAAILDQADASSQRIKLQQRHIQGLASSDFKNFVDSVETETLPLAEISTIHSGTSLPKEVEGVRTEGSTMLLRVSDMNAPGNEKYIASTSTYATGDFRNDATVQAGTVVFPKRGAAIATNKKRICTDSTFLDPNTMGVHPRKGALLPSFLYSWFQNFDLATITSGSTVPQLNKKDLYPILVATPSLADQVKFQERTLEIDRLNEKLSQALISSRSLQYSLQARAFRGEL